MGSRLSHNNSQRALNMINSSENPNHFQRKESDKIIKQIMEEMDSKHLSTDLFSRKLNNSPPLIR